MKELVFAYGTLMDQTLRAQITGRTSTGPPDAVAGFCLSEVRDGVLSYPALIPDAKNKEVIQGVLFDVAPGELELLDLYEGTQYLRKRIRTISGQEAWIYVKNPSLFH